MAKTANMARRTIEMLRRIVDHLTETVTRRGMLGSMASRAAALTLGIFGMSRLATAGCGTGYIDVKCCCLCSSTTCTNFTQCSVIWCWTCPFHNVGSECYIYKCVECYTAGADPSCQVDFGACDGTIDDCGCTNIICSAALNTGGLCLAPPA